MRRTPAAFAGRLCSSSSVDARASGLLSVRQRLRAEPLDREVLALIQDLRLGQPPCRRGRGHRDSMPSAPVPNVLARMGFIRSAHDLCEVPQPQLAEIAFAGRSNVGKSSLLNVLSGEARTSSSRGTIGVASVANRPGVTRSINFYGNKYGAQLVDLPGYGFAFAHQDEVARWQEAMRTYLTSRGDPLRVMLVVDARQSLKQSDRDFLLWLDRQVRAPLHLVMSKCDLIAQMDLARRYTLMGAELRSLQLEHLVQPHHMVSSRTGAGVELLLASITTLLPDKLLRRATKRSGPKQVDLGMPAKLAISAAGVPKASTATTAGLLDASDIATPAARRFADNLVARRAEARWQAVDDPADMGREELQAVARDFWAQRAKMRSRLARDRRR